VTTLHKSSRLGLAAVVMMAERPEERVTAAMVATALAASEDHVAKVLQQLAHAHILTGMRGAGGGYRLAGDPHALTMLDVVEALEGPIVASAPDDAAPAIRGVLEEIGQHTVTALRSVTIASLAERSADDLLPAPTARVSGEEWPAGAAAPRKTP
jgi:Rrf2 family protein